VNADWPPLVGVINILVAADASAKLVDSGIARSASGELTGTTGTKSDSCPVAPSPEIMGSVSLCPRPRSMHRQLRASGTRWKAGATFVVDRAGLLRSRHTSGHAGDLPPPQDAVAAVSQAA